MSRSVTFLPEADDDVYAAYAYYERQPTGLGDEFLAALRDAVDRIRDNPQLYSVFSRDIRAAPLQRFPYVVYFRDRGADVLIVAVQHGRRSSRSWGGRA